MGRLKLTLPAAEHEQVANELKQEFFAHGEQVINGSALLDQLDFPQWLKYTVQNRKLETVRNDWVVCETFFAVREGDGKIVGMLDLRHNLDHPFLAAYGGHIGYAVRPSERRKGYATRMLELALVRAKELGIPRVMLGCYAENLASAKTILHCGGILTEEKPYVDGKSMLLYWITVG